LDLSSGLEAGARQSPESGSQFRHYQQSLMGLGLVPMAVIRWKYINLKAEKIVEFFLPS
jgi:hypothetical protein